MKNAKIVDLRIATMRLLAPRFLELKFKEVQEDPTYEECLELINKGLDLVGRKHFVILDDVRNTFILFEKELYELFATHPEFNELRIATAHLTNRAPTTLIATMYIKKFKPKNDIRVFHDEAEAMKFLQKKLDELSKRL